MALHLRGQGKSLRDIAAQLVITKGAKKGNHRSPATVMRMLRDHDDASTPNRHRRLRTSVQRTTDIDTLQALARWPCDLRREA